MRTFKVILAGTVLVLLGVFLVPTGCEIVRTSSGEYIIVGFFSFPTVYVTKDGSANFKSASDPVTGTDIKDAVVTVTNTTTGVSTTAAYTAPTAPATRGFYISRANLAHTTGQSVSLRVEADGKIITGSATKTPSQSYTSVSPSSGAVTRPFPISWTVTSTTEAATHTWVTVHHASDPPKSYQVVVPISQTSIQITAQDIGPGSYTVGVYGINSMSLTGAKDGSIVYVGSEAAGQSSGTITVN